MRGLVNTIQYCIATQMEIRKLGPGIEPGTFTRVVQCLNHLTTRLLSILVACNSRSFFRVATFNDCEDAAAELQAQIKEAREDLRSKGFNFEQKSS